MTLLLSPNYTLHFPIKCRTAGALDSGIFYFSLLNKKSPGVAASIEKL